MRLVKRSIQKRSFLLLELLVSLALILLCLFPLIQPHAKMCQADRRYLEEMQLERIAQLAFSQIKERLYENNIHSWESQAQLEPQTLDHPFLIDMGKNKTKKITCSYTTHLLDKVNKPSLNRMGIVIQITMHFSPSLWEQKPFTRTLYLEQRQA